MITTPELQLQGESPLGSPSGSVRALSLWRPWADWVMLGWKRIETRTHRRFRCLGEHPALLAIHASDKWDKDALRLASPYLTPEQIEHTETVLRKQSLGGHVLGTVLVTAFMRLDFSDEHDSLIECTSVERFGLELASPRRLETPMKARGMQGLFRVTLPAQNAEPIRSDGSATSPEGKPS